MYSSSARELKVETVKPDTPEKEEDDIDIDAIWETLMMLFLCCGFDSHNALYDLNGWPPPVLLPALTFHPYHSSPSQTHNPLPSALWHDLT